LADLGEITQKSGKVVHAFWATMEPASLDNLDPRGRCISHDGENDVCQFYPIDAARRMMIPAQVEFLDRLLEMRDEARVEYCTPEAPTVRQAPQASKRKQNERRKT
jgi:predicted NUDIX family NTP pyrophosphohydrolase